MNAEMYTIPQEIKSKIPFDFYIEFSQQLLSVFDKSIFELDEAGCENITYFTSTSGWMRAMKSTCSKLDLQWLWDYYCSLLWFESDLFDGIVADRIMDIINCKQG